MSVTSGFFNSLNGDRKYSAEQFSELFNNLITDGVFGNVGNAFAVSADTGNNVNVGTGRSWFDSVWLCNDALLPIALEAPEVLISRIDAIVIEIDKSEGVRAGTIKVIKGTAASSPSKPTMSKTETLKQYPIAYINRKPNASSIAQADITYAVGTSECPLVTGILDVMSIDNIVAQWQSQFDIWFGALDVSLSGDVAANLAAQILDLYSKFDDLATIKSVYTDLKDSTDDMIEDSSGNVIEGRVAFSEDGVRDEIIIEQGGGSSGDSDPYKVGDILTTVRTDLDDKWLLCNGDEIDAMEYPGLYNISQIIRNDSYNSNAYQAYVSFAGDYKFYYLWNDSNLHWENLNTGETGIVRGGNSNYLRRNICIGNGFTVGQNANANESIVYRTGTDMSDQNTAWTTTVISSGKTIKYILFGGGYFIACLSDYSLWYSTNPNSWTQITKPSGVTSFYNIKFTNNLFVICGVNGKIYFSSSITSPNWQEANTGIAGGIYTIEYYNGIWVAGGKIDSSYYFGCISTASEIDGAWTPGSQLSGVVYDVSHLDIGVWIILAINTYNSAGYLYVYENDMKTVINNTTTTSFNPNMSNTYYNDPFNNGVHTNSQYVVIVGNSSFYENYTLNFSKLLPTISPDGAYSYIRAKE